MQRRKPAAADPVNRLTAALASLADVTQRQQRLTLDEAHAQGFATLREIAEHFRCSRQHAGQLMRDAGDAVESVRIAGAHGLTAYRRR